MVEQRVIWRQRGGKQKEVFLSVAVGRCRRWRRGRRPIGGFTRDRGRSEWLDRRLFAKRGFGLDGTV